MSDTQNTALVPVEQRAVLALNSTETEKHLRELAAKHADITVIKNKDGRDQAHGAAMELLKARTAISAVSKTAREDATKFSKAVIAEENRLIAITEAEEKRLFALRDEWDAEQERIRQEKVRAEQLRVEFINAEINDIASVPLKFSNESAENIGAKLAYWRGRVADEQVYQEFTDRAQYVISETVTKLESLYAAAVERELEAQRVAEEQRRIAEENARLAAERAELERQRQELEAERARAAAEAALAAQKAADEASAKAKREAAEREAFLKQQQDAFEEEKREAEAKLKAEQDKLAAERAEIARAHVENQNRIAREREARELAEYKAAIAKQEEVARLRRAEISERSEQILNDVIDGFGVSRETAIEYLAQAAEFFSEEVTA